MSECSSVQPLLAVVADGDATADERWRVRAHVGCCSACRIQFARERLLSVVLREWRADEPAASDEGGARDRTRRARDRRGLRLAVLAGVGFATAALGALTYARAALPWHAAVALPRWGDGIEPLLGVEGLLRLAWSSLHAVLGGVAGVEAAQLASFTATLVLSGLVGALLLAVAGCGILAATLYRGSRRAA